MEDDITVTAVLFALISLSAISRGIGRGKVFIAQSICATFIARCNRMCWGQLLGNKVEKVAKWEFAARYFSADGARDFYQ